MIIGIDLDNTIINHNKSFKISYESLYKNKKVIKITNHRYKDHLKNNLTNNEWIQVQEKVYSDFLNIYGKFFSGFKKFLLRTKILNHKLLIVSHKSKYSLKNKINLHDPAYIFLQKLNISKNQILFFQSLKQKIQFINNNKFDYFIDDLSKVIDSISLNKEKKILFGTCTTNNHSKNIYLNNWSKINKYIYKNISPAEIEKYFNFCESNNFTIEKTYSSNNSFVMKIISRESNYSYKLKISNQGKQRIKNEFNLVKNLNKIQNDFHPIPIRYDLNYDFALYEWIEGENPKLFNKNFTNRLTPYLKSINTKKFKDSKILEKNASSSCFCYNDIFIQIEKRLKSFYGLNNFELNKYLNKIEKFYFLSSNNLQYIKYRRFPKKELILSPSDLSLKNFILNNKNVYFIDYEYFGLDNAIKLLCDTILHPNNKFSKSQSLYFFKNYNHFIRINVDRFKKCFYLYGLIWCLIILNPLKTGNGNSLIINKSKKFFYSLKKKYTQRYLDEITKI